MIVRILNRTTNKIVVSYPNLKNIPLTPQSEQQLCDYVWNDAVSSKLVIEEERECYRFEVKKHPTKQQIDFLMGN